MYSKYYITVVLIQTTDFFEHYDPSIFHQLPWEFGTVILLLSFSQHEGEPLTVNHRMNAAFEQMG